MGEKYVVLTREDYEDIMAVVSDWLEYGEDVDDYPSLAEACQRIREEHKE